MIHPHTELRDAGGDIGLGVFATRRIARGTIVWAEDPLDIRLPLERVRAYPLRYRRLLDRYGFLDASGLRILCWDIGRFVNHSCDPNVLPTPWKLEVAVRTIHAGEQITNDYATLNLEKGFRCGCDLESCRRFVRPGDFERLVEGWDDRVRATLPASSRVVQPLLEWLDAPRRRALRRASARPDEMPSIVANRLEAARIDPRAYAAVGGRSRRPTPIVMPDRVRIDETAVPPAALFGLEPHDAA